MLKDWEIIHEMDDEETGLPTGYAKEFDGQFFWVTQFSDGWHAETSSKYSDDELRTLKVLKTAKGCMRWVENNYRMYVHNRKDN